MFCGVVAPNLVSSVIALVTNVPGVVAPLLVYWCVCTLLPHIATGVIVPWKNDG